MTTYKSSVKTYRFTMPVAKHHFVFSKGGQRVYAPSELGNIDWEVTAVVTPAFGFDHYVENKEVYLGNEGVIITTKSSGERFEMTPEHDRHTSWPVHSDWHPDLTKFTPVKVEPIELPLPANCIQVNGGKYGLHDQGKYKSGMLWITNDPWLPGAPELVDLGIGAVRGYLGSYHTKMVGKGRTTHVFDTTVTPTHVLVQREFTGVPKMEVTLRQLLVYSKLSASNGGRNGYIYDVFKLKQ